MFLYLLYDSYVYWTQDICYKNSFFTRENIFQSLKNTLYASAGNKKEWAGQRSLGHKEAWSPQHKAHVFCLTL